MSLLENVDPIISKIDGLKEVMLAIDPEIQLVRTDISNLIKELYIKTTEQFIRRWEEDFSLSYDPALSLQQRRQRILNKLARKKTLTWTNLGNLIQNNIDHPQYYISNHSGEYRFTIIVQTNNTSELFKAVKEAKPAYITFDIVVTQYFRRCGTFNSGAEPI
jgi:hypothetical protein